MQTQWNVGVAGCTGLRYESLYPLLDRAAADAEEWDALLHDIQAMEAEVLIRMRERASEA